MFASCDILYMDRRLAKNLRRIREEQGLTQEQLAARAEAKQATISQIESGKTGFTRDSVLRLARALGVDIEELFFDDETRRKLENCKLFDDLNEEEQQTLLDLAESLKRRRGQRDRSSA